jgi:GntR family transcriptional regulator/MocR family aminotransferase
MRTVRTLDIPLLENPAANLTRQDQVYRSLRQAITGALLQRGEQVPSTRELAARWHMSRGTIEQAYERLTIEGYLERRQGAGTFVAARLPDQFLLPDAPCKVPRQPVQDVVQVLPGPELETPFCSPLNGGRAFVSRVADPALLDMNRWRHHLLQATRRIRPADMLKMEHGGLLALRRAIAAYVKGVRGIDCSAGDVIITTGIRQALGLVAGLLKPGQTVNIEDPGYLQAREMFASRQLEVRGIAVDAEGLCVAGMQPAEAVYVTPAHQSPLGCTMSASRRAELLAWAEQHRTLIIEDDYDSEYNYLKSPPPALKSSDSAGLVLFCGSFNKVLYSSLRIGFMIAPPSWREALIRRLYVAGAHPGLIEQQALASMIESGDIYAHIRQCRRVYQRRRDIVLHTLARRLDKPRVGGEHCGFHFVLWLPAGSDDRLASEALEQADLSARAISSLSLHHGYPPGLQLSFAAIGDERLLDASERLCTVLAPFFPHTHRAAAAGQAAAADGDRDQFASAPAVAAAGDAAHPAASPTGIDVEA